MVTDINLCSIGVSHTKSSQSKYTEKKTVPSKAQKNYTANTFIVKSTTNLSLISELVCKTDSGIQWIVVKFTSIQLPKMNVIFLKILSTKLLTKRLAAF